MDLGRLAHGAALKLDRLFERVRPGRVPEAPVLDPYRGYAVPGGLVLRGRVLASLRRTTPDPGQSRWQNIKEMASLFLTDEVAGVTVTAPVCGTEAESDPEGYVFMEVPLRGKESGWQEVMVEIPGVPGSRQPFSALIPRGDARIGIVSDIDDTMLHTGAYSLARNLWTTFTGSARTRRVFPDAIVLVDHLTGHGRNPIYYVSSSPWNLHAFLEKVFDRAGLMPGPMFLRDYGLEENKFITSTHSTHKSDAIDRVLAANPGLPFVLIGDTGQHDAEIYLEACHKHGSRIRGVILREHAPGQGGTASAAVATMRRQGVTVVVGDDFSGVAAAFERAGIEV